MSGVAIGGYDIEAGPKNTRERERGRRHGLDTARAGRQRQNAAPTTATTTRERRGGDHRKGALFLHDAEPFSQIDMPGFIQDNVLFYPGFYLVISRFFAFFAGGRLVAALARGAVSFDALQFWGLATKQSAVLLSSVFFSSDEPLDIARQTEPFR